jgi:hypothetical protein
MYRFLLLPLLLAGCGQDQAINKLEPKLAYSPGAIEFGEVAVDYTATVSVEVINAGRAGLDVNAIHFGGGNPGIFSVEPTTWSSSRTILKTVRFGFLSRERALRPRHQTSRSTP